MEPWALSDARWPDSVVRELVDSWQGGPSLYKTWEDEIAQWRRFSPEIDAYNPELFSEQVFRDMHYEQPEMIWGMVRHQMTDAGKIRFSAYTPLELWITSSFDKGLPSIVCNAQVLKIIVSNKCAYGATVMDRSNSQTRDILANTVVLAAGTIENSRLVIQALSEDDASSNDCLGGLSDHIVQGFTVKIPGKDIGQEHNNKFPSGPLFLVEQNSDSKSNIFAQFNYEVNKDLVFDAWSMGEQAPNNENLVRCERSGALPWQTFVRTTLSEEDLNVIKSQQKDLQKLWDAFCGLLHCPPSKIEFEDFARPKRTLPDVLIGNDRNFDYYKPVSYVSHIGTVEHEGCTLSYGKIIDDFNQFLDISNLFAVGPSTFPRLGAANPALTAFSLVRRLAHILALK